MKIFKYKDLPEVGVSHNPEIKKRMYVNEGDMPHLNKFGSATFKPGQSVKTHKHDDKFELFYIQSGKAVFMINQKEIEVSKGDCVIIEPKEKHSQANPFEEPTTWLYLELSVN